MVCYRIPDDIRRFYIRRRLGLFLFAFVVFIAASEKRDFAQQLEKKTIRGVVNDASGNIVPDAIIRLQQAGATVAMMRTDSHGSFTFVDIPIGTYLVEVEKTGAHASQTVSTRDAAMHITLPLTINTSSSPGIDFTDKPNFTVAGITDWTAVGGHGSDASLRTSETLARVTATLKQGENKSAQTDVIEASLRAATAAQPQSFAANRELGRYYLQKGAYREAEPPLETAYRIDPRDHGNEYDLACVYKEVGDLSHAKEYVNRLLAKADIADFHRLAGDVDEAMGDALAAEGEYEAAVRLDPSERNEFTWGAELLLHRAVWPAVEVFRKGIVAYPKSARMLSGLGAALFASAQYEEAAQRLCEASDLNPRDREPYIFLGEIDMATPAPLACAETKLGRFVQQHPEDSRAYYYYAMSILKRQAVPAKPSDVEHARSLLGKSIEIDPKYGEPYLQLGILSANKKDYVQAIDDFTRAIQANPQMADAHYRLGVMYQKNGEETKAEQEFERHKEIEKAQAEAVEQQRHKVRQFIVVLRDQPSRSNSN